jgi:hypothetical protein
MARAAVIALFALTLAAGASAKAPPSGIKLCGTNGCATIDAQTAEQLFTAGGAPRAAPQPAPFYRLRWTWENGQEETGGYWLPDFNALQLGGWVTPDAAATATLTGAANGLQPFAPAPPTSATVGRRPAADPASYARLLTEGTRVSSWVGALDWIRVELESPEPSPWTDPGYDLRISKGSGFVWREGAVYRIPLALARLARSAKSIAPSPPPAGFSALGAGGCAPASPRHVGANGWRLAEVFGTATGSQLWALFFLPAGASWSGSTATLVGTVGKDVKIVVRFGARSFRPAAVGPDGLRIGPDWGPTAHGWSNWERPGSEWGVGYTFPEPGCWRIHAGDGVVAGDLWLDVQS